MLVMTSASSAALCSCNYATTSANRMHVQASYSAVVITTSKPRRLISMHAQPAVSCQLSPYDETQLMLEFCLEM